MEELGSEKPFDFYKLIGVEPPTIEECIANRKSELNFLVRFIDAIIQQNIDANNANTTKWWRQSVALNLKNLRRIRKTALNDLTEESFNTYGKNQHEGRVIYNWMIQTQSHLAYNAVMDYAPPGSINQDLRWLTHASMKWGDVIEIALQKKPLSYFEALLPIAVSDLSIESHQTIFRALPALEIDILQGAIKEIEAGSYLHANLLLLPFIEHFVREGCRHIRRNQHNERPIETVDSEINDKFSFRELIEGIPWPADIEMELTKLIVSHRGTATIEIQKEVERLHRGKEAQKSVLKGIEQLHDMLKPIADGRSVSPEIQDSVMAKLKDLESNSQNLLGDVKDIKVKIGLTSLLYFLVRRHTDDRNELLHGNFKSYHAGWRSYTYLRAIAEICRVFILYKEQHGLFLGSR